MSAPPKLPATLRATVVSTIRRRRELSKLIATLKAEQQALPTNRDLARQLEVSESLISRVLHGEPYRTPHPADATSPATRYTDPDAPGSRLVAVTPSIASQGRSKQP